MKPDTLIKSSEFIAEVKLFNIKDLLVSNGFYLNCHLDGEECEACIIKIKDKEANKFKNIIKNGDNCICSFKSDKTLDLYENMKIIFRKNDSTLGYGKIIKIKV